MNSDLRGVARLASHLVLSKPVISSTPQPITGNKQQAATVGIDVRAVVIQPQSTRSENAVAIFCDGFDRRRVERNTTEAPHNRNRNHPS